MDAPLKNFLPVAQAASVFAGSYSLMHRIHATGAALFYRNRRWADIAAKIESRGQPHSAHRADIPPVLGAPANAMSKRCDIAFNLERTISKTQRLKGLG
jgi:hypothetical protein